MAVRVGVIGLGFMGATHVNAYQSAAKAGYDCVLTAVADQRPNRRAGELWDVGGNAVSDTSQRNLAFDPAAVKGYATAEELLCDRNVDLVSICTPTDTHVSLAVAALAAGKHVLVEKPVALKVEEAQKLDDAARKSDRLCMPAMCMRFWPAWAWLKDRITDGSLGSLQAITFTRLSTSPSWNPSFYANGAMSGGALVDLHIHDADFVRFCFGHPASVQSTGYIGDSGEIDHLVTSYRFTGASAPKYVVAEGGWDQHEGFPFRMRYVARFDKATADFDLTRDHPLLLCHGGNAIPIEIDAISGYDGEVRHLLRAILENRRDLLATTKDAVEVARLLQAEKESVRTGRVVEM